MQFDNLSGFAQKGLLLLLNFADDIALVFLTRLGFNWGWLQLLSKTLIIATVIYWSILQIRRYLFTQAP
ncbi:MAG: hypothetical protein F6K58_11970 [Symploca sp. SIO2E9]|nr:hypothetical protein [Symploca sp. SIO2E9]